MIPQHLIERAAEAWTEMSLADMHPVDAAYARADARAALEAVAADIWEQGAEHGALTPGYDPDDNPYRIEHA